jgi:hypothetical protein
VLEWLDLGHCPAKVLTPYHELVARLTAKGCTHCCELLGHEPSNIVVPFSKDQQHWLWQFSDLWQSELANFPEQIGKYLPHSKLLQFASLHVFVFPKLFYPSLYQRLSQFSLMLLGVVLRPITPKIAIRLNILFLPQLKGQSCIQLLGLWGRLHHKHSKN